MTDASLHSSDPTLDEVVLDWTDWLENRDRLTKSRESNNRQRITVVVTTELPIDHPHLGTLLDVDKVVVDIESFTDGRVFGLARLLRDKLGFAGELHANGNYLSDQVSFLARCGFDTFSDVDAATETPDYYSGYYQPPQRAGYGPTFIRRARLER